MRTKESYPSLTALLIGYRIYGETKVKTRENYSLDRKS